MNLFNASRTKDLLPKKEVRTLSISALQLKRDSVVWDIGTCTGSVAIEAAKIAREGQIFAVEKNEADLENCRENLSKFRVDAHTVHGKAPEGLNEFADPDAVFIGGYSRRHGNNFGCLLQSIKFRRAHRIKCRND